jgi:uncharacterized DUF497 family protein
MPIRITGFEWDEYNEEHIAKHHVTPDEVEACFFNPYILKRKKRNKKRYYLYGQTDGRRTLFIVFELYKNGVVRPISARDMDANEKRDFRRQRRD